MDERNVIINSFQVRDKFNKVLIQTEQEPYAESTIHKCFKSLSEAEIIKKLKGRGAYQVNPLFIFKGTEIERQKLLREQLEELNKVAINKYRREKIIQKSLSLKRKAP